MTTTKAGHAMAHHDGEHDERMVLDCQLCRGMTKGVWRCRWCKNRNSKKDTKCRCCRKEKGWK